MTRNMVTLAAKDLNRVLDLSPPINTRHTVARIQKDLAEAANLLTATDVVTPETRSVIDALSVDPAMREYYTAAVREANETP